MAPEKRLDTNRIRLSQLVWAERTVGVLGYVFPFVALISRTVYGLPDENLTCAFTESW